MKVRTSRRGLLVGVAAASFVARPTDEAEPHPDAAILALEPELRRRMADVEEAREVSRRIDAAIDERVGIRPDDLLSPEDRAWMARAEPVRAELGFRAADDAIDAAHRRAADVADRILALRPRTLDGLQAKARVIRLMEYDPDERLIDDILAIPGGVA